MEFSFDCSQVLKADNNGFSVLNSSNLLKFVNQSKIEEIINTMGYYSAKAQQLKSIITSKQKILNTDYNLFIKSDYNKILGILKTGYKKLFIRDEEGKINEINPLCVLDFYVHESVQRLGVGKSLFEFMLKYENIMPHLLGYDRPSPKMLNFLHKHYYLSSFVPQNNNYVVFKQYFESFKQQNYNSPRMKNLSNPLINSANYYLYNSCSHKNLPTVNLQGKLLERTYNPPKLQTPLSNKNFSIKNDFMKEKNNFEFPSNLFHITPILNNQGSENYYAKQFIDNIPRPFNCLGINNLKRIDPSSFNSIYQTSSSVYGNYLKSHEYSKRF